MWEKSIKTKREYVVLSLMSGDRLGEDWNAPNAGATSKRTPVHLLSSGKRPITRLVNENEKAQAIECDAEVRLHPELLICMTKERVERCEKIARVDRQRNRTYSKRVTVEYQQARIYTTTFGSSSRV